MYNTHAHTARRFNGLRSTVCSSNVKYAQSMTLTQLISAIQNDRSLTSHERETALRQLMAAASGMSPGSSVSPLLYRGVGGVLGNLLGKYLGFGGLGRTVTTLAGIGAGGLFAPKPAKPIRPSYLLY